MRCLVIFAFSVALTPLTLCGDTCWKSSIVPCTNTATWQFFMAGRNMTQLCRAAEVYFECINTLPVCKRSDYFFDAIRIINSHVTLDDCPSLKKMAASTTVTTVSPLIG